MCRESHIDVSRSVLVSVFQHYSEAVGKDIEVKRIAFYIGADLCLVVHRHRQERIDPSLPPSGNCEEARPLFVYLHNGELLPPPLNGSPYGTRKDSSAVDTLSRLDERTKPGS